jgi:FKBP-type peptidyl-prolyl cis-trans isomerase FklB
VSKNSRFAKSAAGVVLICSAATSPVLAVAPPAAISPPMTVAPVKALPPVSTDAGSFDLGLVLGNQLAHNGLAATISRAELQRGIEAALGGKLPSPEQKDAALQFMHTARDAYALHNADLAHAFLEENSRKRGITTLPSGLQYKVLAQGDPKASVPGPKDQISVRYVARLADGTEIDRSDDHAQPAVFRLNSVIKGWNEALSAMRPGAKWQVFVPPELGYGANSPPAIPPGSVLVYELELMAVEAPKSPAAR